MKEITLETIKDLYENDSYARDAFNAIAAPIIHLRQYEEAAIKGALASQGPVSIEVNRPSNGSLRAQVSRGTD